MSHIIGTKNQQNNILNVSVLRYLHKKNSCFYHVVKYSGLISWLGSRMKKHLEEKRVLLFYIVLSYSSKLYVDLYFETQHLTPSVFRLCKAAKFNFTLWHF